LSFLIFFLPLVLKKVLSIRITIFYHEGFFLIPKTILLEDSQPIRVLTLLPIEVRIWKTNEFLYDFDRSDIMFEKLAKKYNRGSGSSYYISESLPSSRQGVYFINDCILILLNFVFSYKKIEQNFKELIKSKSNCL
jgi:hypothetical protein